MKLRIRRASSGVPGMAPALASIAVIAALHLLLAFARETDATSVELPVSRARADAGRVAACVVLSRAPAVSGAEGTTAFAFTDGEGPSQPLGGVTDVFLAALQVTSEDPERPFAIKADEEVRYGLVDDVVEQLRKAGVKRLTLLTRPRVAEEAP